MDTPRLSPTSGTVPPGRAFSSILWAVPIMAVWGTSYVVIHVGLRYTSPIFFAALRALPAGLLILILARVRNRRGPTVLPFGDIVQVVALGLLCTGLFFWSMFEGTPRVGAGLASVLVNTQPFFVAAGAYVFLREPIDLRRVTSLTAGGLGVFLISLHKIELGGVPHNHGIEILLVGAAGFSVGLLISKGLYRRYDLYWLTGWQLTIGGLFLLLAAILTENISRTSWTPPLLVSMLYLSLVGTAITSLLWFRLVRFHSVTVLASFGFLSPVMGVILAWLVLGEHFPPVVFFGMLLVIAGLYGMGRKGSQAKPGDRNHPA